MTEADNTSDTPQQLAEAHHGRSLAASPIYGFLLQNLHVSSATEVGQSISSLVLEPHHLNSKGSIHGSVSAAIVDWASGNALATMGSHSGLSLDMHVTFLNTCKGGEKIIIKVNTTPGAM
jgi:acyl-coenzyme A thioesterase 13